MKQRYALCRNGVVVDVVVWDPAEACHYTPLAVDDRGNKFPCRMIETDDARLQAGDPMPRGRDVTDVVQSRPTRYERAQLLAQALVHENALAKLEGREPDPAAADAECNVECEALARDRMAAMRGGNNEKARPMPAQDADDYARSRFSRERLEAKLVASLSLKRRGIE